MKISILCDNPNSWIIPFAKNLSLKCKERGHDCAILYKSEDVTTGQILILMSCEKIFNRLHLNKHNLVVHESALPIGKGWSPLTWQVLEGVKKIPITLFEAKESVDSGLIYNQEFIDLDGTELIDELRVKQGNLTVKLLLNFIDNFPNNIGVKQSGSSSYYKKRNAEDSILNINESINDQIDLLRVCDNERYPAFFIYKNNKYILKIYKDNNDL